jgi:hypothetical protein
MTETEQQLVTQIEELKEALAAKAELQPRDDGHKTCRETEQRLREANRRLQAEGPALERDKLILALRAEVAELKAADDESEAVRSHLSAILTRTANVLNGPPPDALVSWSWHNLPELAATLKVDREKLRVQVRELEARLEAQRE